MMLNCIPICLFNPEISLASLRLQEQRGGTRSVQFFFSWTDGDKGHWILSFRKHPLGSSFPNLSHTRTCFQENWSLLALPATSAICPSLYGEITVFRRKCLIRFQKLFCLLQNCFAICAKESPIWSIKMALQDCASNTSFTLCPKARSSYLNCK